MKAIGEIKMELQAASETELPLFVKEYEADERSGVVKMVQSARKKSRHWKKKKQEPK